MGRTSEKKDCLAISWHSINMLSNTESDPTRDFCLFTSKVPTERFVQGLETKQRNINGSTASENCSSAL